MTPTFTTDDLEADDELKDSEIAGLREQIAESMRLADAEGWAYFMHMGDAARAESEARG